VASDNVAIGFQSLYSNVGDSSNDGWYNTAVGYQALYNNNDTSGTGQKAASNAAVGSSALYSNTTGSYNTASGAGTLKNNTAGTYNAASGTGALEANTTGNGNTANGVLALDHNSTGVNNTAVGYFALSSYQQTGGGLTCIGYNCGVSTDGLSNATAIGAGAVVGQSNALVLGGTGTYAVNVGIGTSTPQYTLDVVGNVRISGSLSKGSGSFQIDHPLDPANKYLYHSFVESPDMMNVYNGNVVTNQRGVATVTLPDYFESLNRDFRYQLTVIGQFAEAIVARKIEHNRFMIRTSKSKVEVSWQVTGIRQDAFANAHRIPVEEEKKAEERGRYLHPELFGATEQQAIGARATQPGEAAQLPTAETR
jgi:hypothetical protein